MCQGLIAVFLALGLCLAWLYQPNRLSKRVWAKARFSATRPIEMTPQSAPTRIAVADVAEVVGLVRVQCVVGQLVSMSKEPFVLC